MRGLRGRIGLAAAATLAAFVLVESALRICPPQVASAWVLGTHKRVLDPDVIYVDPHHTDPSFYRRDPKLPTVVALGDSFTEGFPLPAPHSYPSCLERILKRAGYPANVINLGTGDSGPDQQLRLFRRYALEYAQPDVVIWQFYENDIWDNVTKPVYTFTDGRLEPLRATDNWMYRRQLFYDATPLPRFVKRYSYVYQYMLKSAERWAMAEVPEAYANDPVRWANEKIRLEITQMEGLASVRGFRVYYVVVPPQAMSMNATGDATGDDAIRIERLKARHDSLRGLLTSRPGYIDLDFRRDRRERRSRANEGAKAAWLRFYVGGGRDLSHLGSRHLNQAGYHSIAHRIARRLIADFGSRGAGLHRNAQAPLETEPHLKN